MIKPANCWSWPAEATVLLLDELARAQSNGASGAPSTSNGPATRTGSSCWAIWMAKSCSLCVSHGVSRATTIASRPPSKQAVYQGDAVRAARPLPEVRDSSGAERGYDQHAE